MGNYIVTHTSPDWDAIGYAWLMQRYGGAKDMHVVFVNTGAPDPAILADAWSVGDTGRIFDPGRRRFDHHHLPGNEANETCATHQAYMTCIVDNVQDTPIWRELHAIGPLVRLIYYGDTGKSEANESRILGIHALLSATKAMRPTDQQLLDFGYDILDRLAKHLIGQAAARSALAKHMVYASEDGLVVALLNAPQGATFAAHEAGARLVVFASEIPDVPTYARGVMRGGEGQDVHCGALVEYVCADTIVGPVDEAVVSELLTWYRHEAGFFAGKGTQKAPCAEPMSCDIRDIARAIDRAWIREASAS